MKRRLLLVHPQQYGYAAAYSHYCKYLREAFDIHFICFDHGLPHVKQDGVRISYLSCSRSRMRQTVELAYATIRELRRNPYDVCLCAYFRTCAVVRMLAPNPRSLVLDVRTGSVAQSAMKRRFDDLFLRSTVCFFSHVVTLSDSMRTRLRLPRNKTDILPLGAEVPITADKDFTSFRLLYVGTLNGRRIADTVRGVAAFAKQVSPTTPITYDILGFGSPEEVRALERAIEASGMADRIVFHGRKQYGETAPFLRKCNIGVSFVPMTDFYDCQPATKTFEYVLAGMVCIGTATKENRAVITPLNGALCEDSPEGFCSALEDVLNRRQSFNVTTIQASLSEYAWPVLVRDRVLPYFSRIAPPSRSRESERVLSQ